MIGKDKRLRRRRRGFLCRLYARRRGIRSVDLEGGSHGGACHGVLVRRRAHFLAMARDCAKDYVKAKVRTDRQHTHKRIPSFLPVLLLFVGKSKQEGRAFPRSAVPTKVRFFSLPSRANEFAPPRA